MGQRQQRNLDAAKFSICTIVVASAMKDNRCAVDLCMLAGRNIQVFFLILPTIIFKKEYLIHLWQGRNTAGVQISARFFLLGTLYEQQNTESLLWLVWQLPKHLYQLCKGGKICCRNIRNCLLQNKMVLFHLKCLISIVRIMCLSNEFV